MPTSGGTTACRPRRRKGSKMGNAKTRRGENAKKEGTIRKPGGQEEPSRIFLASWLPHRLPIPVRLRPFALSRSLPIGVLAAMLGCVWVLRSDWCREYRLSGLDKPGLQSWVESRPDDAWGH